MIDREKVMGDLTALAMFLKDKKDPISLLQANICTDALELLKALPIQNGDKLLIPPDYMLPGRINPSLSVNPPRIVPKNDKKKGQ